MHWYDPHQAHFQQCFSGTPVGGFTIQQDGGLLLFMQDGMIAKLQDGRLTHVVSGIEDIRGSRFDYVIADPAGRVFCGTMATESRPGRLYRLDVDGSIEVVIEDAGLSNGLGFSPGLRHLYHTDSLRRVINRYDYDAEAGRLAAPILFVDSNCRSGRSGWAYR
jgi:sugar lactone lactonase YvrE